MQLFACFTSEHSNINGSFQACMTTFIMVSHRCPHSSLSQCDFASLDVLNAVSSPLWHQIFLFPVSSCWATHLETVYRYCCFPLLPKTAHETYTVPLMTSAALASHFTEKCSEKNCGFTENWTFTLDFLFFFFMCTLFQYFGCISCVALWTAGLLTRIRARLAVVAQRQWHPPCNSKWNRNTLLQIKVCFQLCEWLNWQTDSFVFMAYFVSYF